MDNTRNTVLAVALSLLVLIGWQYFIAGPRIEAQREAIEAQEADDLAGAPQAPNVAAPEGMPRVGAPTGTGTLDGWAAPERVTAAARIAIETPSLSGSINARGGRIDDLLLTQYRETVDRDSSAVRLFSPTGTSNPYFADFGWAAGGGGLRLPNADTVWQVSDDALTPTTPVLMRWDNGQGLVFERRIAVDENYMFEVTQTVRNAGEAAVTLFPYARVQRQGLPDDLQNFFILHEGPIGIFGDEGLVEVDYSDLDDERRIDEPQTERGWVGITDKYWASAIIPRGSEPFTGHFVRGEAAGQPTYQADFLEAGITVPAGGEASNEVLLFAGAKVSQMLDDYEESFGIERFELLIDWGWFYFITKPFFAVIDWFYNMLGNFGLAILATTVVVKLLFLPLANKSYASMARMKAVQPKVEEIKKQHGEDRMAMQQAMMELYKTEKINPLAGCWPVLIQIPVFFSLYKVLFVTIEMRHAPFFGWIDDLSAPDPTSIFNLFGLLPYEVPAFLLIGAWPLIMGVTMFIQMRLNPTPPDKTQAMIFNWMPVVFTFMLASFPAGLVIYWAWNNFLSILQQAAIMKRHGAPIALFDNLKGMFGGAKKEPAE